MNLLVRFSFKCVPTNLSQALPCQHCVKIQCRLFFFYTGYASTSTDFTPIRLLDFKIEYRDRTVNLTMPDNETVGELSFKYASTFFH